MRAIRNERLGIYLAYMQTAYQSTTCKEDTMSYDDWKTTLPDDDFYDNDEGHCAFCGLEFDDCECGDDDTDQSSNESDIPR